MIKPSSAIKICLVAFAVFLLSSCAAVTGTKPNVHETEIHEGKNVLRITIQNNEVVLDECIADETPVVKKCFKGETSNLKLVDTKGTDDATDDVNYEILNIKNHTTIRVDPDTASPGCTFYFWRRQWWEVCD